MIKTKLFNHQLQALQAIDNNEPYYSEKTKSLAQGFGLFMDMGTGKTLTSLVYADKLFSEGKIKKCIIVCPKSIMWQWKREILKHTDEVEKSIGIAHGEFALRIAKLKLYKYVIINFDGVKIIPLEISEVLKKMPCLMIIDESSHIKHGNTKRSMVLHVFGDITPYKLILTGAPITTGAENIWSQYRFTNPLIFGDNYYRFLHHYMNVEVQRFGTQQFKKIVGIRDQEDFKKRLNSGAFIIKKEDCLDLPEKIFMPPRLFELSSQHKAVYDRLAKEYIYLLQDETITYTHKLQLLSKLRQVANGFIYVENPDAEHVKQRKQGHPTEGTNQRLKELEDLIEELDFKSNKIIIVFAFNYDLFLIDKVLTKMGVRFARITRGFKLSEEVDKFKRDDCPVLVGQIQMISHGLDLSMANAMIHFSHYFSTDLRRQVFDRIHRIGQTRKCVYVDLAAKGTVDIGMLKIHAKNIDLADMLVHSSLNKDNIQKLVFGGEENGDL